MISSSDKKSVNAEREEIILKIFKEYKKTMWFIACRILQDEYLAEDIVQDAMINILKNPERFVQVDRNKVRSLIGNIVRGLAINEYHRRRKTILEEDVSSDYSFDAQEDFFTREAYNTLRGKIESLGESLSGVLILYHEHGLSVKEIAGLLGITEDNVRQRLHRAKGKLAKSLSKGVTHNGKV